MLRRSSPTNVSAIRTISAPTSKAISGAAAYRFIGSMVRSASLRRQLALRDVLEQFVHRGVHQVGERLRVDAHPEHGDGEQPEHDELARTDVLQRRHAG